MKTLLKTLPQCPQPRPVIRVAVGLVLIGGLGVPLTFTSCSKAPGPPALATVGDRVITVDEFQREVARRIQARQTLPDKETLLQEMVEHEALAHRARQAGLLEDPQVQREINFLLIGKLQDRELAPQLESLQVSDVEIQTEYEKNIAKYTHPAKVRLAMLHLEANPKMSQSKRAEIRARLDEARRQILAHPTRGGRGPAAGGFGSLAIDYSDDQASRYRGGDLGWLDEGSFAHHWPRPVLETGYSLEKGQVSDVMETEQGFYLIMKTDFRPSTTTGLAEVKTVLKHRLLARRQRERRESFQRESVRMAEANIDRAMLEQVELPTPGTLANAASPALSPPGFSLETASHEN